MKKVIGTTTLSFGELYTILIQIEAFFNSRTLTPISNDPIDLQEMFHKKKSNMIIHIFFIF